MAKLYDNRIILMKCFKGMGETLILYKKFALAKTYVIKYMQMSWFLNQFKHESKSYDLLGIIFYYLGNIDRANFYHDKMVRGIRESRNSELKKLCNQILSVRFKKLAEKKQKESKVQNFAADVLVTARNRQSNKNDPLVIDDSSLEVEDDNNLENLIPEPRPKDLVLMSNSKTESSEEVFETRLRSLLRFKIKSEMTFNP